MRNLQYRGSGSEVLENLTERLTFAWSFQMVAFQISSEKQICSANTLSSTIRRPSRQVNFVPPALLSLFHLLAGAGVDVCFSSCRRLRFDGPDFFHKSTISFWFHVPHLRVNTPTTDAKYKNNNSLTPKIFAPLHVQESRNRAGRTRDAQKMCALAIGATALKVAPYSFMAARVLMM